MTPEAVENKMPDIVRRAWAMMQSGDVGKRLDARLMLARWSLDDPPKLQRLPAQPTGVNPQAALAWEMETRRREHANRNLLLTMWAMLVLFGSVRESESWGQAAEQIAAAWGPSGMDTIQRWDEAHRRNQCGRTPDGQHPWACARCAEQVDTPCPTP